jgi:hypothetical protein
LLFLLFFISGFSSLVYQVVWTRMAFASFGIIAPVLSVVISVFMLGLSLGAWLGGRFIKRQTTKPQSSAIVYYMLAELVIGLGAFAVPILFAISEEILLSTGQMASFGFLLRAPPGLVHSAMVHLHGGDLSIHDGIRSPARQREFQLPLPGKRARGDGWDSNDGTRARGVFRIQANAVHSGSG